MALQMYGSSTKEQIILNLPDDIGGTVITILIVVNAYTKYALTLHPIAVGLEELVQVKSSNSSHHAYPPG